MSNSIFAGKAIRCTDWNQMLQLAEMAEKEGIKMSFAFNESDFEDTAEFFVLDAYGEQYYNTDRVSESETELSFDQFIQSLNQK